MKTIHLIALIVALPNLLLAMDTVALRQYYHCIAIAEENIGKNNLKRAAAYYDSAWQKIELPYFVDLNNAIYIEAKLLQPDTIKIKNLLKQLQKKGICIHEYYKKRTLFLPYVKQIAETDCKQVTDSIGLQLVLKAIESDQKVRNDTRGDQHPLVRQKMAMVDSIHFGMCQKLLRKYENTATPIENRIGWEATNQLSVLLQHATYWGYSNRKQLELLTLNGLLEARAFAAQQDYWCMIGNHKSNINQDADCQSFGKFGTTAIHLSSNRALLLQLPAACISAINRTRSHFYLQDWEQEAKMRIYAHFHYKDGFAYPGIYIEAMPDSSADALEAELKQKYKLIKYSSKEDFDWDRTSR